jgi:hypothetical protein
MGIEVNVIDLIKFWCQASFNLYPCRNYGAFRLIANDNKEKPFKFYASASLPILLLHA